MENIDLDSLVNEALVKVSTACFMAYASNEYAYAVTILRMALCIAEEVIPETSTPDRIESMIDLAKAHRFNEIKQHETGEKMQDVIMNDPKAEAKLFLHSAKTIASVPLSEENRREFLYCFKKGLRILYEHDRSKNWVSIVLKK